MKSFAMILQTKAAERIAGVSDLLSEANFQGG